MPGKSGKKGRLSLRQQDYAAGYLMVAPILILMCVWFYFPAIQSLVFSLQEINFLNMAEAQFVGLANYQKLLADPEFRKAAVNTLVITLVCVPALVLLGFIIAYNIEALRFGKGVYRTLYYIPAITSAVALTMSVMYLFVERGAIPSFFHKVFGVPNVTWPADVRTARVFVCILVVWKNLGFFAVMYITGLKNISPELLEAAEVDGANGFQRLTRIIIPQVKPTTVMVLSLSIIWCMQCFDEPFTLARSGTVLGSPAGTTSTMVTFFYSQNFRFFQPGYGSAAAFVIFLFLMLVSVAQRVLTNRFSEE